MVRQLEDQVIATGATRSRHGDRVWIEPCPRWVRTWFGHQVIADSRRVLLVFEPKRLPVYWFPLDDVRTDLLEARDDGEHVSTISRWSLRVGERVAENAAWAYRRPEADHAALAGHLAFYWNRLDAWFEEDDEVFVHPRDPYQRVDVLHSSRHVRVQVDGHVVADSTRPRLLFETGLPTRYYLPRHDVRTDLLVASERSTRCPYKGVAVYWSLRLGDRLFEDLVWSYPAPIPECPKIENLLCFFNERTDIEVDGERQPRPTTQWSRPER